MLTVVGNGVFDPSKSALILRAVRIVGKKRVSEKVT
jgi:hypothetical protein